MKTTARALALLALAATIVLTAGCGTSEPTVVTPREPTPSTDGTPTPLAEIALTLEPIADGFDQPLYVTGAGDGSGRLFVVEKTGRIWVLRDGARTAKPFLDLSGVVSTESEQGLLGLAFSPDFAKDRTFWVDYTDAEGSTVIASYTATGDAADAASARVWLTFEQPYANHNGGMIAFGPDGYLYIGTGDGGSGGDPHKNGQNLGTFLGKLLRIDVLADAAEVRPTEYAIPADNPFVGTAGALPEIWAYGLRNPWRFSFDRATGDLWIGDVGQNLWEEIDFQRAASAGGENYGWRTFEGTHPFPEGSTPPSDASASVMPVVEYDHIAGNSVTGGYVYRGAASPALEGVYIYGDFGSGRIWGLRPSGTSWENVEFTDTELMISSFGEDDAGEIYVVDYTGGAILRLAAE